MSFQLWLFYYNQWQASPSPLPDVVAPSSGGSKGGGGRYDRLSLDYWDARQQFMAQPALAPKVPLITPPAPERKAWPAPKPVVRHVPRELTMDERDGYLAAMKGASSLEDVRRLSRKLTRNVA